MNKYFSTIILVAFFGVNLCSQNSDNKPKIAEIRKNNYQIELGFSSIQNIYSNTAAATIMFKKKYNPGELIDVSSIRFLRAYFTLNSEFRFDGDTFPKRLFAFDSRKNVNLSVGFGIEKQFQNRNFVHYFGCDFFTHYYNGGRNQGYSFFNVLTNYSVLYQYEKNINLGLIPFFGLKYYVTDQLSFGVETGLSLSYYYSKFKDVQYSFEFINGQEVYSQRNFIPFTEYGMKFNFLGLRFINIGYAFK